MDLNTTQAPASSEPNAKASDAQPQGAQQGDAPQNADAVSPKLALLAKKERAILRRAQEIKDLETKVAEREAKLNEIESLYEKAKQDPDTALNKLGWNYEKLTNYYLNNKQIPPEMQVKAVEDRMEAYIREQAEKEAKAKEQVKLDSEKQVQEALKAWEGEVKDFIGQKSDEYELINMHQAYNMVTDLIKENFQKNKKVLSTEEAAKHVEEYLEHLIDQSVKSKRLQGKYASKGEEQTEAASNMRESVTLTNSVGSSMPGGLPAKSDQERIQRALARLNK